MAIKTQTSKSTKSKKAVSSRGSFMKRFTLLFAVIVAVIAGAVGVRLMGQSDALVAVPAVGSAKAPVGYELTWSDEFNGSSVSATNWNVYDDSNYGSGGHSDMCYFDQNAVVTGGQLRLNAKRETVDCGGTNPDTGKKTYHVTSGAVTTRSQGGGGQKFAFKKGYVEASIRLPLGNPYWGAFWLVGAQGAPSWPQYGEFDVMEQLGAYPDAAIQTLHYSCGTDRCNTNGGNQINVSTLNGVTNTANRGMKLSADNKSRAWATTSKFVRYGFLWEDERITWYIDGRPTRSFDGKEMTLYTTDVRGNVLGSTKVAKTFKSVSPSWKEVLNYSHTIILNLAYGGDVPAYNGYTGNETANGYDDGNFVGNRPSSMDVDYVRVYQKSDTAPTTPEPTPTPKPTPPRETSRPEQDTQRPTVSITSPATGTTLKGTVSVKVAAGDNKAVSNIKFAVNGTTLGTDLTSPYEFKLDTSRYDDGVHRITAVATDSSGNVRTSRAVTVRITNAVRDRTKPVAKLTSPTANDRVRGVVTIKAAASDNNKVQRVSLYVNGQYEETDTTTPYSFKYDTRELGNGPHKFHVSVTDAAGNRSVSKTIPVNVQNWWWLNWLRW